METLEHGMYCEVTREQAIELLTIEGFEYAAHYAGGWHDSGLLKYARYDDRIASDDGEILLSGIIHGDMYEQLPFPDFKQRLINTVNNK